MGMGGEKRKKTFFLSGRGGSKKKKKMQWNGSGKLIKATRKKKKKGKKNLQPPILEWVFNGLVGIANNEEIGIIENERELPLDKVLTLNSLLSIFHRVQSARRNKSGGKGEEGRVRISAYWISDWRNRWFFIRSTRCNLIVPCIVSNNPFPPPPSRRYDICRGRGGARD